MAPGGRAGRERKNVKQMAGKGKEQLASYNLLKIMAIFMVVAVHMMHVVPLVGDGDIRAFRFHEAVRTLLLTSNGLFFMTSGRFLIEGYDGRMGRFYRRRAVKIGLPVLAASLFYYVYVYGRNGMSLELWKTFVKDLLQSQIQGYFWFVYALAGFYLAVPFLARMFAGMEKKEKCALLGISLAFFFVQNLYQIAGLEMVFTSYPFYSWVFYCILGYLIDSLEMTGRQKGYWVLAGVCAFFVAVWEICFWEKENPALHNYSLTMILMTTGVYLLVTSFGKGIGERFSSLIQAVSGPSFYLYLMHGFTQYLLSDWFSGLISQVDGGASGWFLWLGLSVFSFGLAWGMGWLLERAYRPAARLLCGRQGRAQ